MEMMKASSSNGSFLKYNFFLTCISTNFGSFHFTFFNLTSLFFMFPVCVLILYLGLRQWWQQRSTSTGATTRHSDVFVYHLVVMELVGVLGCILCIFCIYVGNQTKSAILLVGLHLWNFPWIGQGLFHSLTCVDRYLAVVHPIIYLSFKSERGIRIRNICIGCVWLICFTLTGLMSRERVFTIINCILVICSFLVISFCSISVLSILIHPGPGGKPGSRGTSNRSKMKAFYIVMLILGVMSVRLLTNLTWIGLNVTLQMDCVMDNLTLWFNFPCTVLLPLLFLRRAETFTICMNIGIKKNVLQCCLNS